MQADVLAELARVDALAEQFTTEHRSTRVRWRRFGNGGRSLVLLHGGHGNWMHWLRNVEALSSRREVWVPDMPGFGVASDPPSRLTPAEQLAWIEVALQESVDQLPFSRQGFDLAGFSFGALVASALARRSTVNRLALVGPAGHGSPRRTEFVLKNWREFSDVNEVKSALKHNLAVLMLTGSGADDPLALAIHEAGCRACRVHTRAVSRMGWLPDRLALLKIPMLALWGDSDVTAVPEVAAQALGLDVEGRAWQSIGGAGHWVQYQKPDVVNRALDNWFFEGAKI